MEAEHVHDADCGKAGAEEVGSLGHAGSDEKSSIRAAGDGEFFLGGVFFTDEKFTSGDEIIEDILFFELHAGLVPFLTVFATATEAGHGVNAAHVEPGDDGGRVEGLHGIVESTVGVEVGWVLSVELNSFFMNDEERDFGAVFGGVKNLLGFVVVRVDFDLWFFVDGGGVCVGVVSVDGIGRVKRGVAVEGFFVIWLALESVGGADAGEGDAGERGYHRS